jgi:hypothetical protein
MKRYALLLTLFYLYAAASLMSHGPSADNEKKMITVFLNSDRKEYAPTGEVHLDVKIANATTEPLTLYGRLLWGYAGGLTLHITDDSNREITPKVLDDDLLIPSTLTNPESFVVLAPNHFLGTTRIEHVTDLVKKPGTYFVHVEYRSPVPTKFAQGPNFWGFEKGPVSSETVELHITH